MQSEFTGPANGVLRDGNHIDGNYIYVFSGIIGTGIGTFRIAGEQISGGDYDGVTFGGSVTTHAGAGDVEVTIDIEMPGLLGKVQKFVSPLAKSVRRHQFTMPADFATGRPFETPVHSGSVWLIVRPLFVFSPLPAFIRHIADERNNLQAVATRRFGTTAYWPE